MILVLFGIYVLIAAQLQISRHYGLKGRGARVAGAVFIAFGLGFPALLGAPISFATKAMGLGDIGTTMVEVLSQILIFIVVFISLVRVYGNMYAQTPSPTDLADGA